MANRKKRLAREKALLRQSLTLKKQLRAQKALKEKGIVGIFEQMKTVQYRLDLIPNKLRNQYPSGFFNGIGHLREFHTARKYRSAQKRLDEIIRHPKLSNVSVNFAAGLVYFLKIYHEFVQPINTWSPPKSKNEDVLFQSLFIHLFVRYPLPKSAIACINTWNFLYTQGHKFQIVAGLVHGDGIHKMKINSLNLNGKMNFIFRNAPGRFQLIEAVWWAKIRGMGASEKVAYLIIGQIRPEDWTHWQAWIEDFIFFVKKIDLKDGKLLKEIFDFLKFQHSYSNYYVKIEGNDHIRVPEIYPGYSLKGRSLSSVSRHLEEWKTQIERVKTIRFIEDFPEPNLKNYRYETGNNQYIIRRIKNFKELAEEGRKMKHCVASYFDSCIKGESSIWSVRRLGDKNSFKRLATVEIEFSDQKHSIGEFQGKCNTRPSDFVVRLVKIWAKEYNAEVEDWEYC